VGTGVGDGLGNALTPIVTVPFNPQYVLELSVYNSNISPEEDDTDTVNGLNDPDLLYKIAPV